MSGDQVQTSMFSILERWGFPTLVAIAFGFVLRNDLLLPLMNSHQETLKELRQTQREIADTIKEQTKLLYAIQPRAGEARDADL